MQMSVLVRSYIKGFPKPAKPVPELAKNSTEDKSKSSDNNDKKSKEC